MSLLTELHSFLAGRLYKDIAPLALDDSTANHADDPGKVEILFTPALTFILSSGEETAGDGFEFSNEGSQTQILVVL
jgi:hypothetical protein